MISVFLHIRGMIMYGVKKFFTIWIINDVFRNMNIGKL